jgi:hypothetical protein
MRGHAAARLAALALALHLACASDGQPGQPAAGPSAKSSARVRAARRAYDGAPPVIPHAPMGASCASCHNQHGIAVGDLGFAPPSPHELTAGIGATARCQQCHVYQTTTGLFAESTFVGFAQDLRPGRRLYADAPPTLPHATFMRENCTGCHSGPAARDEIRTPHPERLRCRQCHVPVVTGGEFDRPQPAASL